MKQSQVTQAKNENAATRYQHRGLAWVGETSIWNISFSFTGGFEGTKTKIRINTSWLKEELPLTRLKMRNQISNPSTSTFNIGGITIFRNVGLELGRDTHKFSLRKVRNLPFPCLTANKILQPSFAATTAVPWRLSRFYSCPIDHILGSYKTKLNPTLRRIQISVQSTALILDYIYHMQPLQTSTWTYTTVTTAVSK